MYIPGSTSAARVDVAFTPPMHTTISAEPAAARRAERPRISGSTAHGASTPGSTAADVEPTRMVKVGHSANAAPASSRVARDPIPSASASRTSPRNATVTSSDIQSRSATQTGTCSACAVR